MTPLVVGLVLLGILLTLLDEGVAIAFGGLGFVCVTATAVRAATKDGVTWSANGGGNPARELTRAELNLVVVGVAMFGSVFATLLCKIHAT